MIIYLNNIKINQVKGIPKFLRSGGKEPALMDIIEGRIDASSFYT